MPPTLESRCPRQNCFRILLGSSRCFRRWRRRKYREVVTQNATFTMMAAAAAYAAPVPPHEVCLKCGGMGCDVRILDCGCALHAVRSTDVCAHSPTLLLSRSLYSSPHTEMYSIGKGFRSNKDLSLLSASHARDLSHSHVV